MKRGYTLSDLDQFLKDVTAITDFNLRRHDQVLEANAIRLEKAVENFERVTTALHDELVRAAHA
jgi:hypothetical protein